MFLSTVGTSKTQSSRDKWHSGWWFAKLFMWLGLTIFPFLLPSTIIQLYGIIKGNRLRLIVFRYQNLVSMTKCFFFALLCRGDCPFWCRVRFISSYFRNYVMVLSQNLTIKLLFFHRVFLLIQLISIISFITWLNECFQAHKDAERW